MIPAKNTPTAGPSCAPDCTKAENRPRFEMSGTARATAATLAGMYGPSKAPSSTRNVAVSQSTDGAIGVNSTHTDQPAIEPASVRRDPALSAIQPPTQ